MKAWEFWISFFHMGAAYYAIQLVRCTLISFAVFVVVLFLRKTLLKNRVFLKGALWSLLLPVLFAGKMKFFYETPAGAMLFSWWIGIFTNHIWVSWLYLCGVSVCAARLFGKRRKLGKLVAGMEKRKLGNSDVYVAKMPVTPFTTGIFRPKIVMPEVMLEEYGEEELQTILLHEKVHIRLGHLFFYFLWDACRALLWLNPLFTIGTKLFREDMEEICDWVTIRENGGKTYAYGQLLLKSIGVLQAESEKFNMFAAFAEDKEYGNIRRRMEGIVRYRPYKRTIAAGIGAASVLCAIGTAAWIGNVSYDRSNENDVVLTYGYDGGEVTFFDNSDVLYEMISYDDDYVYVDRRAFENYLREKDASGEVFIVFGGFYKLPGFVGMGYSCCYEPGSENEIVRIAYDKREDDWRIALVKML